MTVAITLMYMMVVGVFGAGLSYSISGMNTSSRETVHTPAAHVTLGGKFRTLKEDVEELHQAQQQSHYPMTSESTYNQALTTVQIAIDIGQRRHAMTLIQDLEHKIRTDNTVLGEYIAQRDARASADPGQQYQIPILIYHYTPADFDHQLSLLEQKGYTTLSLDALDAAMHGTGTLPPKPVIITFDDGFANQMTAFELLRKHQMLATYYIISGGERSKWCIGAGRRVNDPAQPPQGCGDAYLTWDQVRTLDASGIITIASHTVDHENLSTVSPEEQRYQIFEGKRQLERQIGHPVRHVAYPYGGFNSTTVALVREAGFVTAVSTLPGMTHNLSTELSLHRLRSVAELP